MPEHGQLPDASQQRYHLENRVLAELGALSLPVAVIAALPSPAASVVSNLPEGSLAAPEAAPAEQQLPDGVPAWTQAQMGGAHGGACHEELARGKADTVRCAPQSRRAVGASLSAHARPPCRARRLESALRARRAHTRRRSARTSQRRRRATGGRDRRRPRRAAAACACASCSRRSSAPTGTTPAGSSGSGCSSPTPPRSSSASTSAARAPAPAGAPPRRAAAPRPP